jgi:hypothetical protein
MKVRSRRDLLKSGAVLGAGLASGQVLKSDVSQAAACCASCSSDNSQSSGHTTKWDHEYTFGHTKLFMEEYLEGALEILGCQSAEIEQIADIATRAANVIKNGGKVYASTNVGHMPRPEQTSKRRGHPGEDLIHDHNPSIPRVLSGQTKDEVDKDEVLKGYDHLKKGDMVITNHCNKTVQKVRDDGVYIVAVTANYITNEFRHEGFSHPNEDNMMLKDVSNEILHSHVPFDQGLVYCPEIPEFTLCPSSGVGQGSLFWMLAAEIATNVADKKAKPGEQAAKYLRTLTERVNMIKKMHMGQIREAAVEMTRRIMDGGRWFARSLEHPGIASEVTGVASGPMIINWGDWDKTLKKNVMTISAISPAYPEEIKLAKEKQLEGAFVIGIGPCSVDGVQPSGRLIDVADIGFNNFSPEYGGVISVKGRKDTICPTSGIVSNIIQQMLCAQWTDEMCRRGAVPWYWMGFFQVGGAEYDRGIRPFFQIQGY